MSLALFPLSRLALQASGTRAASLSVVGVRSLSGMASRATFTVSAARLALPSAVPATLSATFSHRGSLGSLSSSTRAYSAASSLLPPPKSTSGPGSGSRSGSPPKVSLWTKLSQASTFLFASSLVLGAVSLAGFVVYLLFAEILLPSGETQVFNRAVALIEKDAQCQALLNFPAGERLKAYGETAENTWTRNRPVHSQKQEGKDGKSHLLMRFHVETSAGRHGSVTLENIEASALESSFAYIALDIKGQARHYVIAPKFNTVAKHKPVGLFDLKWGGSKKD